MTLVPTALFRLLTPNLCGVRAATTPCLLILKDVSGLRIEMKCLPGAISDVFEVAKQHSGQDGNDGDDGEQFDLK